jgi:hypothetical protein
MAKKNSMLIDRWLAFNIRGDGLHKSSRHSKYSYNGPIYYSHGWPIARLVKLPNGNWACLNKHHVYPQNPKHWVDYGGPKLGTNLSVPDVAVFSAYEGDWLDDAGLHERLRDLWPKIAAHQVDEARETAFPTLVSPDYTDHGRQTQLAEMIATVTNEYTLYNAAFRLRWPKFPTVFADELKTIIGDRKRHYYSKTEVDKRERAAARAGAKKALGLD